MASESGIRCDLDFLEFDCCGSVASSAIDESSRCCSDDEEFDEEGLGTDFDDLMAWEVAELVAAEAAAVAEGEVSNVTHEGGVGTVGSISNRRLSLGFRESLPPSNVSSSESSSSINGVSLDGLEFQCVLMRNS